MDMATKTEWGAHQAEKDQCGPTFCTQGPHNTDSATGESTLEPGTLGACSLIARRERVNLAVATAGIQNVGGGAALSGGGLAVAIRYFAHSTRWKGLSAVGAI